MSSPGLIQAGKVRYSRYDPTSQLESEAGSVTIIESKPWV